jgi:hypothetical protein
MKYAIKMFNTSDIISPNGLCIGRDGEAMNEDEV